MIFKTDNELLEWEDEKLDKRIRSVVYLLEGYLAAKFPSYRVKITEVFRSWEEHCKIYNGNPPASGNIHGEWRAVDCIIEKSDGENMSGSQHKFICDRLNEMVKFSTKSDKTTALYHDVGKGYHIHLQVAANSETILTK